MSKIRVLVVDDSALMRKMIPCMLASAPDIEVAGTAMDGVFALKKIRELRPDVITLDVNMPRMDGIETLKHIVEDFGIPTLIVSSLTRRDADLTLRALEIGAFDFVTKPQDALSVHIRDIGAELVEKVKAAYENPLSRLRISSVQRRIGSRDRASARKDEREAAAGRSPDRVLAIGVSTGGPNALSFLLPQLPRDFPAGILIVQHMPAGFTEMFAARLNAICGIEVKEAREGDLVLPGRALIAPGDRHLEIRRLPLGTIAVTSVSPPVNGHRPSADALFRSVASAYSADAVGLVMTGMGSDGAQGIREIKERGGFAIAQSEESCVVFGMPKAAIETRCIDHVVSLEGMADFLADHFQTKEENMEQSVAATRKPFTCLVADDSEFARKKIAYVVSGVGGTVVGHAENGREAIELYGRLKPDIVLLDITMPVLDGIDALRQILDADKNARVIMMSALGHKEMVMRALCLGARHYVPKPYAPDHAGMIIRSVVDGEEGGRNEV